MLLPAEVDVVIVGGGLAGLAAARRLEDAGVDWLLIEGADRLGGRVTTDLVDGWRLDRGFQVLNTAYPRIPALVDVDALEMRYFTSGVLVRHAGNLHRLEHPLRGPWHAPHTLAAGVGTLTDRLRFAALAARCATYAPQRLLAGPEITSAQALRRAGLSERLVEEVLRPFLSGVFADPDLVTSSHVLAMVLRSFARGRIGVPAAGMAALPAALAGPLPFGRLVIGAPVAEVAPGLVRTQDEQVRCRTVLVATDPVTAATLLPGLPTPPMRALTTWYFAAPAAPIDEPILLLDGDRRRIIANTIVLTNAAPEYAPAGQILVAASMVGEQPDEKLVRAELGRLYATSTHDWDALRTVRLPHALPAACVPQSRLRKPVSLGDGLFVAGDHRDSPSIQGALASGRRAAQEILRPA